MQMNSRGPRSMNSILTAVVVVLAISRVSGVDYACPAGWETHKDHCYRFHVQGQSAVTEAKELCARDGATLLEIDDKEEHDFIGSVLSTLNVVQKYDYYTDGERSDKLIVDPDDPSEQVDNFRWATSGNTIATDSFWIDTTVKTTIPNGNYIIYTFQDNRWGWTLNDGQAELSFICEIPNTDIYKIVESERDAGFGSTVQEPEFYERGPKITEQPQDTVFDTSSKRTYVTFSCYADGYPFATYDWRKIAQTSSTPLSELALQEPRYTINNGKLTIHTPSKTLDSGNYQCVASNKYGSVLSNQVQLQFGFLDDFPNVIRQPVQTSVTVGTAIPCNAPNHYGELIYQWYKNTLRDYIRTDVKPWVFISQSGYIYFSSVTEEDSGNYICHVYSPISTSNTGKFSKPIQLIVTKGLSRIVEPQIVSGFPQLFPQNTALLRGMEIRLECFAWGTNNLFYQWGRTDGKNMPRRAITKDNNRVVIIPSVELADEGTYECRVQREFGQTATGTVTITLEAEPYFLVSWKDEFVDQGDSVSWSCRANGKPEVDYFWFKNGLPLSENTLPANEVGRFSWTQRKDRLTIQNLKQWDSAMYQCGAKNQYAMRYLTRELKVMRFAPSFIKNPVDPNQFAVQGGNVTIVCQPEAAPKVQVEKITWKKDGGSLTLTGGGRISKLPNGNLLIRSVQYSDRGNYTCVAENDVGSAESTGFLTVVESTSLQMKPSEQSPPIRTTYVGQNLTLYCLATVNPLLDLNYIWRFNDRDIDFEGKYDQYGLRVEEPDRYWQRGIGEYRGNLLIYPVTFDVEGWYECIAKTPADQASAKVELRVEGPPGQPSGIECVTLNSSSVNVTWFPGPDHRSAIQQYKIEGYNTAEGIWKTAKEPEMITQAELGARRATVTGLNPWSTYKFRLLAKNGYGWGEPSKPSPMVTTAQSIPARPVRNITRAVDSKVGTLVVEWEPLPRWEQHGNNTKYKIYYRKNQQGKVSDLDWSTGIVDDPGHRFATTVGVDNTYTLYDIKIQSMNVKGTSDALISPIVEIRSAMGLPVAVPKDIVAEQYNATALEVTWIPVQNTFVNLKGVLAGYRINYWVRGRENSLMAEVATIPGDVDRGLIVGLYPDTYYEVTVMVYNEAGNGEPSQPYPQKTLRQPPKDYPTEVELHNVDTHTIKVSWRGISTDQTEEPLQGYKVKYWRTSEKIIDAKDFDAGKDTFATISDLSAGESYYLRVYGYSRGGQGAMSSPMVMFVMAKSGCTYTQIIPEASYVEKCGSCQHLASVLLLVTALLAQILKTIL